MLGADGALTHPAALGGGGLDGLTAPGGQPLVEGAHRGAGAHQLSHGGAQGAAVQTVLGQNAPGGALLLAGQAQQQVFAAHIAVAQPGGVGLGQTQSPQGGGGKMMFRHEITS